MKNKFCRNCKNNKFFNLLSLGKMSFTGKFSKSLFNNIPKAYLNLVMCKECKLVQLDRNFNQKYLYGRDYGYRSGINKKYDWYNLILKTFSTTFEFDNFNKELKDVLLKYLFGVGTLLK